MGKTALIIVDMQADFCAGGALEVPDATSIFPVVNALRSYPFDLVVLTADWHPLDHCSFASNHKDKPALYEKKILDNGVEQVMWPNHCIQHSIGAALHPLLLRASNDIIITKGKNKEVDSYSGFGTSPEKTELETILTKHTITQVVCVGLAIDFCVGATALDAADKSFKTFVVLEGCRGVNAESTEEMKEKMKEKGILFISPEAVGELFGKKESS